MCTTAAELDLLLFHNLWMCMHCLTSFLVQPVPLKYTVQRIHRLLRLKALGIHRKGSPAVPGVSRPISLPSKGMNIYLYAVIVS